VRKAIALDDQHGPLHGFLGLLYADKGEYGKALAEGERGIALNPGEALVYYYYGSILARAGRLQEGIEMYEKAIRLNPFAPAWYYTSLARALQWTGRYEEAGSAWEKAKKASRK